MSALLMIGTFALTMFFKWMHNSRYGPTWLRHTISDFSVILSIVIMVLIDYGMNIDAPKLNVPDTFRVRFLGHSLLLYLFSQTTSDKRDWLVKPFANPIWAIFLAIGPAIVGTILIFMDQRITAVIVNRWENKLKKGGGYHLNLLVLALQIAVCGLLGAGELLQEK